MPLRERSGDMYGFVTHTWNTVKGECLHDCAYCYMKQYEEYLGTIRLDTEEFRTDLKTGLFIFVGSGIDLFARNIPDEWIKRTLDYCYEANNNLFGEVNKYLFQSKNPARILQFIEHPVFQYSVVCTTIETNRWYAEYMRYAPKIEDRVLAMEKIAKLGFETYITIEPIMDFDLNELVELIRRCQPKQVNIGKNSKEEITRLPHPTAEKTNKLIRELSKFTKYELKNNILKKEIK